MMMNRVTMPANFHERGSSYEGNKNHLVTVICNDVSYHNVSPSYFRQDVCPPISFFYSNSLCSCKRICHSFWFAIGAQWTSLSFRRSQHALVILWRFLPLYLP